MRWQCSQCNKLLRPIGHAIKVRILRHAYCDKCNMMTLQHSTKEPTKAPAP